MSVVERIKNRNKKVYPIIFDENANKKEIVIELTNAGFEVFAHIAAGEIWFYVRIDQYKLDELYRYIKKIDGVDFNPSPLDIWDAKRVYNCKIDTNILDFMN